VYKLQTLVWRTSICTQNLVEIGPEMAEIHLFIYFQDGGCRPSWNYLSTFWTSHDVTFGGLHFPCQWRSDL